MKTLFFAIFLLASQFLTGQDQAPASATAPSGAAQSSTDDKLKALEERVIALEGQLRMLQSKQQPAEPATNAGAAAPASQAATAEQSQITAANTAPTVY